MELRLILAFTSIALLSACSSDGNSGLAKMVYKRTLNKDAPVQSSGPGITRAALDKADLAAIRVSVPKTQISAIGVAITLRQDHVTYLAKDNLYVVLKGGLISSTHGYGYDLSPMVTNANDPIANIRPLGQWPQTIQRQYRVAGIGPSGQTFMVQCSYKNLGPAKIEIVEQQHSLTKVAERCEGDDISFTNAYLLNPKTGFIWMSDQWTGPLQGVVRLEILEPLG